MSTQNINDRSRVQSQMHAPTVWVEGEEGRDFLQSRVAFFAGVCLGLSILFYAIGNTLALALPRTVRPEIDWFSLIEHPANQVRIASIVVFAVFWGLCKKIRFSTNVLWTLDALLMVLVAITGVLRARDSHASGHPELQAILNVAILLTARSALIPSSRTRTLILGSLVSAPVVVAAYFIQAKVYGYTAVDTGRSTGIAAAWALMVVLVSGLTSQVIYGLRREILKVRKLGQYTLEEKLGEGGMGIVYKARHAMLRRPTAVKFLPPNKMGEQNMVRFEREVQLTSHLTHPNTIAIYDYGRTPDGIFYYAMEFLDGIDLDRLLRTFGPQPVSRVIFILRQVCGALHEAHAAGLIHRDIKLANILLCERAGLADVVKVVDFGLVKSIAPDSTDNKMQHESVIGTPHYLAPEAITTPNQTDGRVDIYAIGVVAYRLVSGFHLFEANTFAEMCNHQLNTQPAPLSMRTQQPVSFEFEQAIMACLEKDPLRRPQTAFELEQRLARCPEAAAWNLNEAMNWWNLYRTKIQNMNQESKSAAQANPLPQLKVGTAFAAHAGDETLARPA